MKKLFFIAVALVAFSGVSMAKNVVEELKQNKLEFTEINHLAKYNFNLTKSENEENIKLLEKIKLEGGDFCQEWAMGKVIEEDPYDELDSMSANNYYQLWLNMCYKIKNLFSGF